MKILNTLLAIGILVLVGGLYLQKTEQPNIGSVEPLGGYSYVQYTSGVATNTQVMIGPGILGSVVVTEDPTGTLTYYDATSTAALSGGSSHFTKIATLEAAQAEGVYTFDANLQHGLVQVASVADVDFAGDITVTYRLGY